MNKPAAYETTTIGSGWTPVNAGGHHAVIKRVEETKSKSDLSMLKVYFEFDATDSQPAYYAQLYKSDQQRDPSKANWRGIQNVIVDEGTDYGVANLKRFVTSVEDSNTGFQPLWGNNFCKCFEGKRVGIIFRDEEYERQDGSVGVSAKPFRFCNYEKAFEQQIPELRKLQRSADFMAAVNEGFMNVPDNSAGFLFS